MFHFNNPEIKCQYCQNITTDEGLSREILTHGFFVLSKDNEELVYSSCHNPICHAPLLICKGGKGTIDNFFKKIDFFHTENGGVIQVDFKYHSSCQLSIEGPLALCLPDNNIAKFSAEYSEFYNDKLSYYLETKNPSFAEHYCTIHHQNTKPISDVPSTVWWLTKDQVEQILDIERTHKLRAFPRYMPCDPIFNEIDHFIWKYQLTKESLADSPLPFLTASNRKNYITKNYNFLNLIEVLPRQTQPIITSVNIQEPSHYSTIVSNAFKEFKIFDFQKIRETSLLFDDIWNEYYDQSLQENISIIADDYIADYLKIYSHVDFGLPAIWKLCYEYFVALTETLPKKKFRKKILEINKSKAVQKIQNDFPEFNNIISNDFSLSRIKEELGQILKNNNQPMKFLLLGEQGTGKALFARAIHEAHKASGRQGEYRHVNCTSIQENLFESELFGYKKGAFSGADKDRVGLFEHVNNGTLFLDEIGGLSTQLQMKLLTAVENRYFLPVGSVEQVSIDVTLVFATNKNLIEEVQKGAFLPDLYSRIKTFTYKIPPLRERKGDIRLLADYFIKKYAEIYKKGSLKSINISNEGLKLLESSEWSGNVRDLEGLFDKIIILRAPDDLQEITSEEIKSRAPEDIFNGLNIRSKMSKVKTNAKIKPTAEEIRLYLSNGLTKKEIAEKHGYADRRSIYRFIDEYKGQGLL